MSFRKPFTILILFALSFAGLACIPGVQKRQTAAKKVVEPDDNVLREHSETINRLYGDLKIVSLNDIPEGRYDDYKKYVHGGIAYVIVHPSYYLFFHNYNSSKVVVERERGDFSKNIVDIFVDDFQTDDKIVQYMKEMERRERDFITKASSKERLVILILPQNYKTHPEYPYRKLDEFARYINDATNGSHSVIYIESESPKRGYLTNDNMLKLNSFLSEVEVKSVLLGGGYVDLCLNDFYQQALNFKETENVTVMSELSCQSPDLMR